jgi:hypothetical protein
MRSLAILALSVVTFVACKRDNVCATGSTQQCPCPDGAQGSQTCAADGTKWEACTCAGAASTAAATATDSATATPTATAAPKQKAVALGGACRRSAQCGSKAECCFANGKATCIEQKLPASACGGWRACVTKGDCAKNQICDPVGAFGKCLFRECKTAADCPDGNFCQTDPHDNQQCKPRKAAGQPCSRKSANKNDPVDCQVGLVCVSSAQSKSKFACRKP